MSDITFFTMNENGRIVDTKIIKNSDIGKCPSYIFLPSHYREDGSCRHNEIVCEEEGCEQDKFGKEIYCWHHCGINFGEDCIP